MPIFGITASASRKAYLQRVLADTPLGVWMLDEASGTTALDSSGNARNAAYQNSPALGVSTFLRGIIRAITLNGTTQSAYTAVLPAFNTSASANWTIEAWINTTSTAFGTFASWRDDAGTGAGTTANLTINNGTAGQLQLFTTDSLGNGLTISYGTTYNDGKWHHVVATGASGGNAVLYVDGVAVGSTTVARNTTISDRRILIGANDGGAGPALLQWYAGSIDAVAIYGTALSAARVLAHYQEGL